MSYEVGQQVYFAAHKRTFTSKLMRVTKVGRKWIELNNGEMRFEASTGWVDAGMYTSPGRIWPSEADYEAHRALHKAWDALRLRLAQASPGADVTLEKIEQARELLGIGR